MIPVFADLRGKHVVIFGGGRVAVRKAAFFAREADVMVVSRSHAKGLFALPVGRRVLDVAKVPDKKIEQIVNGAFIVVAALPDKCQNNRIGAICRNKGILFNNANGISGDLNIPSVSSGKSYSIAITTHGKSPAISRYIREHIDQSFTMLDQMIELQDALRSELKQTVPSQDQRQVILWDVIRDPEVWDALTRSQGEAESMARRKYLHG